MHHDRRLHQLMLQEELRLYDASGVAATAARTAPGARDGLSDSASSVHSDLAAAVAADMDDVPSDYRRATPQHNAARSPAGVDGHELVNVYELPCSSCLAYLPHQNCSAAGLAAEPQQLRCSTIASTDWLVTS